MSYGWFDCEGCEITYRTSWEWEDECYCYVCYHARFPCPDWCRDQEDSW